MIRRKGFCLYLPKELINAIPFKVKSEFVELSVLYVLREIKRNPDFKKELIELRDLKREE